VIHICILFLGVFFYDKKVIFIDTSINESIIENLPNCFIEKQLIDESYEFVPNSILLSDIYNDKIRPEEILFNLQLQLNWASKVRFYFLKFMLPWAPKEGMEKYKCKFDKRVLLVKSGYNSSEMRLWGCTTSEEKELDFVRLDRRISYFNRYKRFEFETCIDCWKLGRFFTKTRLIIPKLVYMFLEDRGYDVWRFFAMYADYYGKYKDVSRNEEFNSDFTVSPIKYVCCYPTRICNFHLKCDWCSNLLLTLFDEGDLRFLGHLIDNGRGNVFTQDDLKKMKDRYYFDYVENEMICKYPDELSSLKSCFIPKENAEFMEWTDINVLDGDGNPVEQMDLT